MCWERIRLKLIAFHATVGNHFMAALVAIATLSGLVCFAALAVSNYQPDPLESKGRRASSEIRHLGHAKEPIATLAFRGDVELNDKMRDAVDKAAKDMTRVSCGMVKVDVYWNYNRDRDLPRAALGGDSVVQGVSVLDVSDTMGREDADDLLGITRAAKNPRWNPVWIFLVRDRLEEDEQLAEWTALHEFGHALGMEHVKVGLMEPRAPFIFLFDEQPEWSVEDQNEFCRIYKCDPTAFIKCDLR